MDVEKFIDSFAKRAKEHLQHKVDVAGERYSDEDLEYNQFWMGYLVAYEEISEWLDALFDSDITDSGMRLSYPAVFDGVTNNGQSIYTAWFPDLNDCFANALGLASTVDEAEDVLTAYLKTTIRSTDKGLPEPSSLKDIKERYPKKIVLMITANI